MSQEKVEVARGWPEALSGGGNDFDLALTLVHHDIVFVPPGDQPPVQGAESSRRWMEPDASQEQVVKRFEPVVVTDRTMLDVITGSVWTFDENGLITRIEVYLDHEEAAGHSGVVFKARADRFLGAGRDATRLSLWSEHRWLHVEPLGERNPTDCPAPVTLTDGIDLFGGPFVFDAP